VDDEVISANRETSLYFFTKCSQGFEPDLWIVGCEVDEITGVNQTGGETGLSPRLSECRDLRSSQRAGLSSHEDCAKKFARWSSRLSQLP
jgi:hypothetical protein